MFVIVSIHVYLTVCVMIGWHTQKMTVLLFLIDSGFQFRTHCYQNSSGAVRRSLLFWAMFLPVGSRYAVRPENVGTTALAAFLLSAQYVIIYYTSGLCKFGDTWKHGTALWRALNLKSIAVYRLAKVFTWFPGLCTVLTHGTWYAEMYACFLLFGPEKVRLFAIVLFGSFHVGIQLMLDTGQFQFVMASGLIGLLPSFVCNFVENICHRFLILHSSRRRDRGSSSLASLSEWCSRSISLGSDVLALAKNGHDKKAAPIVGVPFFSVRGLTGLSALVCLAALWVMNCRFVRGFNHSPDVICPAPHELFPRLETLLTNMGMWQEWRMFSPNPPDQSSWIRVMGLMENGNVVDLFQHGRPSLDHPPLLTGKLLEPPYTIWDDQRWCKYFEFVANPTACNLLDFGAFVCRSWPTYRNPAGLHGLAVLRFHEHIDDLNNHFKLGPVQYEVMHYQWCHDASKDIIMGEKGHEKQWYMKTNTR